MEVWVTGDEGHRSAARNGRGRTSAM